MKEILERIDAGLSEPGTICLIGSAAGMLLGQPGRQTEDLDIWARASRVRMGELRHAVQTAGLVFDPKDEFPGVPYLQIVHPGIVQVPGWNPEKRQWFGEPEQEVWRGARLVVTVPPPQSLVASKLVRGDDRDFEDSIWLMAAHGLDAAAVAGAIKKLPMPARSKARDNLGILAQIRR